MRNSLLGHLKMYITVFKSNGMRLRNAICLLIIVAATLFTFFWQLQFGVFSVKSFDWLAFLDYDLAYMVEKFLVDMHYPGVQQIVSAPVDYGSELFYLQPIFRLISPFLPGQVPLQAHYFLFLFHLICSLSALLLLAWSLFKRFGDPIFSTAFLCLCLTSTLFVQYMAFVKPDANIVLLCIAAAFLCIEKFLESENYHWILLSLALAGLSTATKWWGIFMLFPIATALAQKPKQNTLRAFLLLSNYSLALCCIVFLAIVLINPKALPLLEYLLQSAAAGAPLSFKSIRSILYTETTPIIFSRSYTLYVIIPLFLSVAGAMWLFKRYTSHLVHFFSSTKMRLHIAFFLATGILFLFFFMLFDFPFLSSIQIFFTIGHFGAYNTLNASAGTGQENYLLYTILFNCFDWLADAWHNGLLSIWITAALSVSVFFTIINQKITTNSILAKCVGLFLLSTTLFLLLFVTKKNGATQAMLLPFLFFFIFSTCLSYARNPTTPKQIRNVHIFLYIFILLQTIANLTSKSNIYTFYTSRVSLSAEVQLLNNKIQKLLATSQPKGSIYVVNREFPLSFLENSAFLSLEDGEAVQRVLSHSLPGDVIIIADSLVDALFQKAQFFSFKLAEAIPASNFFRSGITDSKRIFNVYVKSE